MLKKKIKKKKFNSKTYNNCELIVHICKVQNHLEY